MRYIVILALAFAFTGSAHGASNDPKATRKGGEEDTASKAAEGTAQQIAKPEIYWLDSAYRRQHLSTPLDLLQRRRADSRAT